MTLLSACEEIANDPKLPGFITDWASDLYDQLMDRSDYASIRVVDLRLLETWINDKSMGMMAIDAALARMR